MLCPILTTYPSEKGITFEGLYNRYRAIEFQDMLADFIMQHNYPGLSTSASQRHTDNTLLPFQKVSVFHKVKFANPKDLDERTIDVVHIWPEMCTTMATLCQGDLTWCLWGIEANFVWLKSGSFSSSQSWCFPQFFLVCAWLLPQISHMSSGFHHSPCLMNLTGCTVCPGVITMAIDQQVLYLLQRCARVCSCFLCLALSHPRTGRAQWS